MIANHQRLLVVSLRRALLQGAFVSLFAAASPAALAEGAEAAAPANAPAAADATTSSAHSNPCASEIATRTGGGVTAIARTFSSCSATDLMRSTPAQGKMARG